MAFFHGVINVVKGVAFIILITVISIVTVSFVYYNHSVKERINYIDEEVYLQNEVKSLKVYQDDVLHLIVEFKEKKKSSYILSYAYHYYDKHSEGIELLEISTSSIVVIKEGIAYLTYSENKVLSTSNIFSISLIDTYSNLP